MNHHLHTPMLTNVPIPSRQLAEGLRHALNNNYARLLETSRDRWDRMFAGKEPSDACVSVRISGGTRVAFDRFQTQRQQSVSLVA